MKVLVLGSGAREHALVRSLAADPDVTDLHAAPGNAGIAAGATIHPLDLTDPPAAVALAEEIRPDLVVVGPEGPLVLGVVDLLAAAGFTTFGPSGAAARLEGSKAFAKDVMASAGVPTAMAHVCETVDEVEVAFDQFGAPYVVKDDGLAAGKGVVVTDDRTTALDHARACLATRGSRVVVEEYLDGPEVSVFCLSDGETVVPLQPAQDFKRVYDGDLGPNTGGMGAYSPLPWAPPDLADDVVARVVQPTVDELRRRGTPFVGVVYAGLALTSRGLRVIEFNARFGDPETQVVLARLRTPLAHVLLAAATGQLHDLEELRWHDGAAVTVVVAAENYPGTPVTGRVIEGLADADAVDDAYVLHAGTSSGPDGSVISTGGRVLSVVGVGPTVADARDQAYEAVDRISLQGSHFRSDIALAAELGDVRVP
ncbi:MAG TPA: phosphoribosylamine--glycine ligase [Candidatus Angelobacter sp.]|nr:phosphoribosylamine--glycine ligase [Candidatus Angelobacter sp.]